MFPSHDRAGGGDSVRGNFEVKTNSSSLPFYLGIKGARGKETKDKAAFQGTLYEENLYNDNNMLFHDNPNHIM